MEPLLTGIKVGAATGASVFATVNLTDANVSVVAAVGITVFACGLMWKLGSRLQKIDDSIQDIHRRLNSLPCGDEWKPKKK